MLSESTDLSSHPPTPGSVTLGKFLTLSDVSDSLETGDYETHMHVFICLLVQCLKMESVCQAQRSALMLAR